MAPFFLMPFPDSLGALLKDYTRFPLLNADQEISLGRIIQRGRRLEAENRTFTKEEPQIIRSGKRAREKLIKCNLRLVVHLSKKYIHRLRGNGMDQADLIQEGILGLNRATELFDPTRGYKFSTYAYWWIRQALTRSIDQLDRICRIPTHQIDILYRAVKEKGFFEQEYGRSPSTKELADIVGKDEADLVMLLERNMLHDSLDRPMDENSTMTLMDTLADDQESEIDDRMELVLEEMTRLKPVEYETLCSIYELNDYEKRTHGEVAKDYGVSRERIRQHKERAKNKIRRAVCL